jgi:hypothetical protein
VNIKVILLSLIQKDLPSTVLQIVIFSFSAVFHVLKIYLLGMIMHAYDFSTQEAETGGLRIQG